MSAADLRIAVGDTLTKISEDWTVGYAPDAVGDNGFAIIWGPDLWRTPDTYTADVAGLEVIAIAGRADSETAQEQLEALVDTAVGALHAAGWRHQGVTPPAPLDIGGITYLTARIRITAPLPTT